MSSPEKSTSEPVSSGGTSPRTALTPASSVASGDHNGIIKGSSSVHIPNLFSSIMAAPEAPNPHLAEVKPAADAWVERVLRMSEKDAKRNAAANLTLLSAGSVPGADATGLRLMADWNHWVYYFDDPFDEGDLQSAPFRAAEEIIHTLAIMEETHPTITAEEHGIRHMFQKIWLDFKARSSPTLQARFAKNHRKYMMAVLQQVHWQSEGYPDLDIEEFIDCRRDSIGTYPAFPIVECANGVDLPAEIMSHPSIQACEEIMTDIVLLGNDILSLKRELTKGGSEHNTVVRLMRKHGMTLQEATDKVSGMLDERYERWEAAIRDLPTWGEETDRQVQLVLNGIRDIGVGTLFWSFGCGRYFGEDGPEIRKTRILDLGKVTADLC